MEHNFTNTKSLLTRRASIGINKVAVATLLVNSVKRQSATVIIKHTSQSSIPSRKLNNSPNQSDKPDTWKKWWGKIDKEKWVKWH